MRTCTEPPFAAPFGRSRFLRLHMSVHFKGEVTADDVRDVHFPDICGTQKDGPCKCPDHAGTSVEERLPKDPPDDLDLQVCVVRCSCMVLYAFAVVAL
jgi:hypothetical protein